MSSSDPHGDLSRSGQEIGTTRAALDAQSAGLRHRFVRLLRDGEGSATLADHEARAVRTLAEVAWAYERITADLTALETAIDVPARRDKILRGIVDELAAVAELSLERSFANATWSESLIALRGYIEQLIVRATDATPALLDVDLAVERLEHLERCSAAALRSYQGYISA